MKSVNGAFLANVYRQIYSVINNICLTYAPTY